MPLLDIDISINGSVLPDDVVAFLREADLRVSQFVRNSPVRVTGFVPSDFVTVYHSLRAITEANLASGTSFCEWGSGFGVVASLAALLEFTRHKSRGPCLLLLLAEIKFSYHFAWKLVVSFSGGRT